MKRIISFILIAILCLGVLTSCDTVKGWFGGTPDVPGIEDQNGPSLEDAASYLHKIYKDKKETTMADFDVVAQVSINGVIFPVTWTSDNAAVTIRESTKTGFYTVDLPDMITEEIVYTLTATIADANGNTTTKSYTFKAPVVDNSGVTSTPVEGVAYKLFLLQGSENRRYYALGSTQNNENKFVNTTLDPKAGAEFFVEKVDGGYKIYTDINGVKTYLFAKVTRTEDANTGAVKYSKFIGFNTEEGSVFSYNEAKGGVWTVTVDNLVYGVGTYGSYTTISLSDESYFTPDKVGSSQFVMQFMTAEYANTLEEDKLPDSPSDAKGILDQLYALADGESAAGEFTLTGKITALDSYNNPTIVVEGYEDMPVYCYRLSVENAIGDIITVTATQMKNYGGTYEFMNCTLVSSGSGETPDTPSDLGIVSNPEVGVAYKFGLFHGNENATVFFNGENYNNYAWYLAYAAAGVDVYLEAVEEVENAYRLFFYNGDAKTYIVAFPRDGDTTKGTLKLDTVTPAEYFTFDTEYNTLIYTSTTGEQFYLGSSGTYKSISCSAISYISNATSYVAHLYAEGATGEEAPHEHDFVNGKCACGEEDPNYVPPEMPDNGIYTIPQALAAADGTEVIVSGTVESFYYAWDDYYGNCSVYIIDADGNKILAFRLATKVELGDVITVTGTIAVYNGTNQIGAGCTATIDTPAGGEGGEDGEGEETTTVTTIPDALAAEDGTAAVVTGIVIIADTWSTQWNNMSVTIKDAEGNTLYVYRLATQVGLGDEITVTGTVGSYNNAKQIAAGATAEILVVHGDNHTYENGKCTVCEIAEPVAGTKVVVCDFSTLAKGTQYADESNTFDDVTVSTHNQGCHFNTQLRIYASDTNDGYAVVTASGVISSLVVNAGYKAATLDVYGSTDGETWVLIENVSTASSYANYTVAIDPSLGYTYLKLDATGAQIRVASLSVTVATNN